MSLLVVQDLAMNFGGIRALDGISFAVANATGCLASALAGEPDVRTAEAAVELLAATLRPTRS